MTLFSGGRKLFWFKNEEDEKDYLWAQYKLEKVLRALDDGDIERATAILRMNRK